MKKLHKTNLQGEVKVPGSKSHIHRFLFSSILSKNITKIQVDEMALRGDDIQATLQILKDINTMVTYDSIQKILKIDNQNISKPKKPLNCGASATTLRFSIIIMLYLFGEVKFIGDEYLFSRPLDFYEILFESTNIRMIKNKDSLEIIGDISEIFQNNELKIRECKSSQFISALLFIIPKMKRNFKIYFLNTMESVGYLQVTKEVLSDFNINYDFKYNADVLNYIEYKNQNHGIYHTDRKLIVPPDSSTLAYFIVANQLGANIVLDLESEYFHPDQKILDIIKNNDKIIDLKDNPDLLPIIFIYTSLLRDQTFTIINFERNRLKESNRVEGIIDQLNNLGTKIQLEKDKIIVNGIESLESGTLNSNNDHRLALSFAISSMRVKEYICINGEESVNKSFPNFWQVFSSLGGKIETIS